MDDDWREDDRPQYTPNGGRGFGGRPPRRHYDNNQENGGRGRGFGSRPRRQYANNQENGEELRTFSSRPPRRQHDDQENNGGGKVIMVPSQKVGKIIGRGGSKIQDLQSESGARIKVGNSNGDETDVTLSGSEEAISKAESLINELVSEYTGERQASTRNDNAGGSGDQYNKPSEQNQFVKKDADGYEIIDWDKLNAYHSSHQNERYSQLPPINKDFYNEDPAVAAMSKKEVDAWRKANHDIRVKRTFDDKPGLKPIPNPVLTFEQAFQDYPEILEQIYKQEFQKPSPIQSQGWPVLLSGEDLIGIAQTGTGKTLAFLLPAMIHLKGQAVRTDDPTVLILAPTRELALQIDKEVSKYLFGDIKSVCLYGGGDRKEQIKTVTKGVDIVIATPGRLNDLIMGKHLEIIHFSYIVLDEADRMLDMGFEPQIRKSLFDVRPDRQTVMTSATWPNGVRRLAESYMKDPIQVNVGSLDLAAVHTVTQQILFVQEEEKDEMLMDFLLNMGPDDKVIVFCGRKATASHIFTELCIKDVKCQALHADRDQSDREAALEDMVDGSVNILIATDVASRGIDIKDLTHVINLDFPRHIEEYVHRIGRTGRAGKTGIAISFMTRSDWSKAAELIKILEEANQEVPEELIDMARRFEAMKQRNGDSRGGRGRGGGGGRGGGFRGGRRDRDRDDMDRWN